MIIKYTNIFHSKASKIYPNLNFGFENTPSGNPANYLPSKLTFKIVQISPGAITCLLQNFFVFCLHTEGSADQQWVKK
jgi:hypothetical protein